jgi:hypothetical protein
MKKSFFFYLVFLCSCNFNNPETYYYYDQYTQYNDLWCRNSMISKIMPINEFESKVTLTGQPAKYWFYEDFHERMEPTKGIYRKFNDSFKLCYRFDSTGTTTKDILPQGKSLFLYNNIFYKEKRAYNIGGKEYVVHSYSEFEGSAGITSFYLENFGFIAYDLHNGYYLLCGRVSEYTNIKKEILKSVCDSLIQDSCFFSIYLFNPQNPCFPQLPSNY